MSDLKHPAAGAEPSLGTPRSGRTRLFLSALASLAAAATSAQIRGWSALPQEAGNFPLPAALYGRRSRRFGRGMEMPADPLQLKSEKPSASLDAVARWLKKLGSA